MLREQWCGLHAQANLIFAACGGVDKHLPQVAAACQPRRVFLKVSLHRRGNTLSGLEETKMIYNQHRVAVLGVCMIPHA